MRQRNKYQKLPTEDSIEDIPKQKFKDFVPEQFRIPQRPIPWTAICYATLLFVLGTILLLCGCLIHVGHVDNEVFCLKFQCQKSFISLLFCTHFCEWHSYELYST